MGYVISRERRLKEYQDGIAENWILLMESVIDCKALEQCYDES